jgi:hypothetical protein
MRNNFEGSYCGNFYVLYYHLSTFVTSRACSMNGGENECIQDIGGKAGRKGDHSEDQDVGGWTILKWILER